jgi:hypothetical protein
VLGGADGGPEFHEASTSAKAWSSRSGSASTTAQNPVSNTGTVQMEPIAGLHRDGLAVLGRGRDDLAVRRLPNSVFLTGDGDLARLGSLGHGDREA